MKRNEINEKTKAMKVLVAGAGEAGTKVIRQLKKNKSIEVIVLDPRENPYALKKGVIAKVDIKETLTPLTFDFVIKKIRPDICLLAFEAGDMGMRDVQGMDQLASALREELASISDIPVIQVSGFV